LTDGQSAKLGELLQMNLRTVRAYLLRRLFDQFWEYVQPASARRFLDDWTGRTMRSRLEPTKRLAKSFRRHQPLCS
jgi:transposase